MTFSWTRCVHPRPSRVCNVERRFWAFGPQGVQTSNRERIDCIFCTVSSTGTYACGEEGSGSNKIRMSGTGLVEAGTGRDQISSCFGERRSTSAPAIAMAASGPWTRERGTIAYCASDPPVRGRIVAKHSRSSFTCTPSSGNTGYYPRFGFAPVTGAETLGAALAPLR